VSTDNVILAGLAAQNEGEFKVVGEPFTEEPYGIGLALDDTDFRMWINDVLEEAPPLTAATRTPGTRRPAPCCRSPRPPRSTATEQCRCPGPVLPARGILPLNTPIDTWKEPRWNSCGR
jgi:hypothetical protein